MEATEKLRSEQFPNLIIGLTGNVLDDDVAAFERAGADVVLSKPLKVNLLVSLIENISYIGITSRHRDMRLEITDDHLIWLPK